MKTFWIVDEFQRIPLGHFTNKSNLSVRIRFLLIMGIYIVEMVQIIVVDFLINKEIMLAFFKYLKFICFQHYYIDASCSLERFIIEVEVIMEFDSHDQTAEENTMHIEPVESEVLVINVSVHDDNGDN